MCEWFANVLRNGCLIWQWALDNATQSILKGQCNVAL
jgi:hypothetical protein